jgi:hypothetical protein
LTLRISLPPLHGLRSDPLVANIASCHKNFLALYLGTNRPGLHSAGCYLVFNSLANSLAVILPLLPRSHCPTGAGVAVLRHNVYGDYLLAELYRHKDARTQLVSLNKATLFVWCSTGSGPFADPWIPKEVVLPLPPDDDQDLLLPCKHGTPGFNHLSLLG